MSSIAASPTAVRERSSSPSARLVESTRAIEAPVISPRALEERQSDARLPLPGIEQARVQPPAVSPRQLEERQRDARLPLPQWAPGMEQSRGWTGGGLGLGVT